MTGKKKGFLSSFEMTGKKKGFLSSFGMTGKKESGKQFSDSLRHKNSIPTGVENPDSFSSCVPVLRSGGNDK